MDSSAAESPTKEAPKEEVKDLTVPVDNEDENNNVNAVVIKEKKRTTIRANSLIFEHDTLEIKEEMIR